MLIDVESQHGKGGLPSHPEGFRPSGLIPELFNLEYKRREGISNVRYIYGLSPDWNTHCLHNQSVSSVD